MRKAILLVLLVRLICVVNVLAVSGCGSGGPVTHYTEPNTVGTWTLYFGADTIPDLPGTSLTANCFNFPSWLKARDTNEVTTAAAMAQRCGIEPSQLQGVDSNCVARPITYWGDPNVMYYRVLHIDYNCPPNSIGKYDGEIRFMGANTMITVPARLIVNKKQILFRIRDCNEPNSG